MTGAHTVEGNDKEARATSKKKKEKGWSIKERAERAALREKGKRIRTSGSYEFATKDGKDKNAQG